MKNWLAQELTPCVVIDDKVNVKIESIFLLELTSGTTYTVSPQRNLWHVADVAIDALILNRCAIYFPDEWIGWCC